MKKYFSIIGLILATLSVISFYILTSQTYSYYSNTLAQVILGGIIGFPFNFPAMLLGFGFTNNVLLGIANFIVYYFIGILFQKVYNSPAKWLGLILSSLYIAGFIAYILFLLFVAKVI